jgi:hypothetical protein
MYDKEQALSCRLYNAITDDAHLFYDRFIPEAGAPTCGKAADASVNRKQFTMAFPLFLCSEK